MLASGTIRRYTKACSKMIRVKESQLVCLGASLDARLVGIWSTKLFSFLQLHLL